MSQKIYEKISFWQILVVAILVAIGVLGWFGLEQYRILEADLTLAKAEIFDLTDELKIANEQSTYLLEETRNKQAIIDAFSGQISNISSTVGTLEKLSKTDEELLKKYSKIYFLNENYRPAELSPIDNKYLFNKTGDGFIHTQVLPFLVRMLNEAVSDGVGLLVASPFRSFETQADLKSSYTVIYGAGTANQFSADQGYSEHQLGTSIDFTTSTVGGVFSTFKNDKAYKWLLDNAHQYGFILSYPEGNSYYKFEPWHWRFVGVSLATRLHNEGKKFYDLDQREIDTYLVKLFD